MVSKIFTVFFLPPGIFITLLLFLAIFHKKGRKVTLFMAFVIYLFSLEFIGNLLLRPLEKDYDTSFVMQRNVDAVVILSGGHNGKRENLPLSQAAFKRAIFGIMLAKKSNLPIVFSGAGLDSYTESDAMIDSVTQLNNYLDLNLSQSSNILLNRFSISYENRSRNTFENASYTKNLFLENGIEKPKIYLVTSAFHMRRSEKLYRSFGFDVVPATTDFLTRKNYNIRAFMPSITGLHMTYCALHEYAGITLLLLKRI